MDRDRWDERPIEYELLDKLMEEIPGKNNYAGKLYDAGFDSEILNYDGKSKKDVSRYHRWFKLSGKDAMGLSKAHRGYADSYMFAAMTTQDEIAGMTYKKCKKRKLKGKVVETCTYTEQKWTFAIPLEIIYLTPLYQWNPYGIPYKGVSSSNEGKTVNAGDRSGSCTDQADRAFNGTNSRIYYLTPSSFFSNSEVEPDKADTTLGDACVLDGQGVKRVVRASGTRVFLPTIEGVGVLRTRYPIFPVHGEGSGAWKEVNALRDVVMNEEKRKIMEWNTDTNIPSEDLELQMSISQNSKVLPHTHFVTLSSYQVKDLQNGYKVTVETTEREGHSHSLTLSQNPFTGQISYEKCSNKRLCPDRHAKTLSPTNESA